MDLNFILYLGTRIWNSIPNPPLTVSLICLGTVLTLNAYRVTRWIHNEGRFDKNLWERILNLVQQNRLRDASALCEIEDGVFARLYKAGIDAARFSRQDSGDNMTIVIQEGVGKLHHRLIPTVAAGVVILVSSGAIIVHRLGEQASPLLRAGLSPVLDALLYITLPGVIAAALVIPAATLFFYSLYRMMRISSKMNSYRLRLLVALFERAARASMDPFASKAAPAAPALQPVAAASAAAPETPKPAPAPAPAEEKITVPEPYFPNNAKPWPSNALKTGTLSVAELAKTPPKPAEPAPRKREEHEVDVWSSVNRRS